MKIISILKKSIILLSLLPIVSIYAYEPSHIANRDEGRGGGYEQGRARGEEGGGARDYARGYNRGEENGGGNGGEGNVIVAPQNPYNNPYNNNGGNPYAPPPPQQDYENPDL